MIYWYDGDDDLRKTRDSPQVNAASNDETLVGL